MIQRIQTVYLLLTTLLAFLFLSGNIIVFAGFDGLSVRITIAGIFVAADGIEKATGSAGLMAYPAILAGVFSFVAILVFTKRRIQIWITRLGIIAAVIVILAGIFYSVRVWNQYHIMPDAGFRLFIPFFQLLLLILALKGIKKDEKLVKSYDRLR